MDPKVKQKTLRKISNGMYVVTSRDGDHVGAATVTWLSQASFVPPLIMSAIRTDSNVFACMGKSRAAAVHILGAHQEELARKFLTTTKLETGMLNGEPFTDGKTMSPILVNAPAYVECRVRHIIDTGGDHGLVVLEVIEAEYRMDAPPLLIAGTRWHYGG
jgi:flavin reductase (DIM6/NTAB) family NADH-FMN oxidoreductase RutF